MLANIHIAPGVYVRVVQLTDETEIRGFRTNLAALFLFTAEQGPSNQIVYIPNKQMALRLFGTPSSRRDRGLLYLLNYVETLPAFGIRLAPKNSTYSNVGIALVPVIDPDTGDVVQTDTGEYVFTFKFVFGDLSSDLKFTDNKVRTNYANPDTELYISSVTPNNITNPRVAFLLGVFAGKGVGSYYDRFGLSFGITKQSSDTVNLEILERDTTRGVTRVYSVYENVSLYLHTDMFGYQKRLDYVLNSDVMIPIQYLADELTEAWLIRKEALGPTNIVVRYLDIKLDPLNWRNERITDLEVQTDDIIITAIQNYAEDFNIPPGAVQIFLDGGSEGSLFTNGVFNWRAFTQMIIDALKGSTEELPKPIDELLVEDSLFIKYIFDPADERAKQTVPDSYEAVKIALRDYAAMKWNTNTGAIVLIDEGPIYDTFDAEHVVNDFICASYVSYSETIVPEYNALARVPHLYHVSRDLPRVRIQEGPYMPFAGVWTAHRGIRKLVKEYSLPERDDLTLKGFNYIIRDEYGYYTDLDRTTTKENGPMKWLYVVEMLVDIKYEVTTLCKPWKHRLETAQWDRLKQIIEEYVLKPRAEAGYITDYDVKIDTDKKYINQNMIPIEITIRPAREIERIVVTIYVR